VFSILLGFHLLLKIKKVIAVQGCNIQLKQGSRNYSTFPLYGQTNVTKAKKEEAIIVSKNLYRLFHEGNLHVSQQPLASEHVKPVGKPRIPVRACYQKLGHVTMDIL